MAPAFEVAYMFAAEVFTAMPPCTADEVDDEDDDDEEDDDDDDVEDVDDDVALAKLEGVRSVGRNCFC